MSRTKTITIGTISSDVEVGTFKKIHSKPIVHDIELGDALHTAVTELCITISGDETEFFEFEGNEETVKEHVKAELDVNPIYIRLEGPSKDDLVKGFHSSNALQATFSEFNSRIHKKDLSKEAAIDLKLQLTAFLDQIRAEIEDFEVETTQALQAQFNATPCQLF